MSLLFWLKKPGDHGDQRASVPVTVEDPLPTRLVPGEDDEPQLVKLFVGNADVGTANPVPIAAFSAILEGGLTELIDKDDTEVSTNDYSDSVKVELGGTYSGEILAVSLIATEVGTGAVRANACYLYVFDTDPTVLAGDTALALADWQSCLGRVLVDDWSSDANGGIGHEPVSIPFHAVSTLYFVVQNLGTAFNDAAGDDEELHLNFEWRRES